MTRPIIPLFKVYMSPRVDEPLLKTIHSGWVGEGPKVKEFEKALSKKFNNPYCLTLSAGTHGLHLALVLAGVTPYYFNRMSVVTSPLSCFATSSPILAQGADIIWADIDPDSLNIDYKSIKEKISKCGKSKTAAIMVMHWGGYPCDMEEISEIAKDYNIPVIEDAAHAYGSSYHNHLIGDCYYSDFAMISLQAIKHLNTCDGGILFCKKESHYEQGKLLRWYGIYRESPRQDFRCEGDIGRAGWKYHMNDVCATIGLVNMEDVDDNITIAQRNANYYRNELMDFSGVTLLQNKIDRFSSYWLFTILVENRMEFARKMAESGIMVSRVHERNDKHSCVFTYKCDLPNLDSIINKMICLPVGYWVTKEDREYIVSKIKEGWE